MTASDLIIAAIQRLTADGQLPAQDDVQTGLLRLNDLIDAWKIEGLTVYTQTRTTWTLTTASSYTVGATGTIVIDRPTNQRLLTFGLSDASVSPAYERPMENFTDEQYDAITQKSLTATQPIGFYYNPTATTGTLKPWPIPTASLLSGVIYANAPAGELALSDTLTLPQGYRRFYRDNLAVELAPDFDLEPRQALVQSAVDSKASVKKANVRLVELWSDAGSLSSDASWYDINVG